MRCRALGLGLMLLVAAQSWACGEDDDLTIWMRAVDSETGRPIRGLGVFCYFWPPSRSVTPTKFTGDDGWWTVTAWRYETCGHIHPRLCVFTWGPYYHFSPDTGPWNSTSMDIEDCIRDEPDFCTVLVSPRRVDATWK